MVSTFNGGQSYIQSSDVLSYLKITNSASADDITWIDNVIIPFVCEYIDRLANTTWGLKSTLTDGYHNFYSGYEMKSIGQYAAYGLYLIGAPIYLEMAPVYPVVFGTQQSLATQPQTLQSLLIWNGNFYQEWVNIFTEGRFSQYWVDNLDGIIYIMGWYWWMGYEAMVQYQYGYNQMAGVANGTAGAYIDPYVYELALLKTSEMFLSNERYTAVVSQGIGGIEIPAEWAYLHDRTRDLEIYIKGYKILSGGWIS